MEMTVERYERNGNLLFGRLLMDPHADFICYTLEDAAECIPEGRYELAWHDSPKFKRRLPILRNVPGRSYILIHAGNTDRDTEGCILVGLDRTKDMILHSRVALDALLARLVLPAFLTTRSTFTPKAR